MVRNTLFVCVCVHMFMHEIGSEREFVLYEYVPGWMLL